MEIEALRIYRDTHSLEQTAAELVRRGATDHEIRELYYPSLKATERRLLDRALEFARADLFGPALPPAVDQEPELLHPARPTDSDWILLVRGYHEVQERPDGKRPSVAQVRDAMGYRSDESVYALLRRWGIKWRAVHALVATETN